jgi:hypothetical protein
MRPPRRRCSGTLTHNLYAIFYALQRHHVILALRFSELDAIGNKERKKYLGALMKPYSPSTDRVGGTSLRFHAKSFMVGGYFILHTNWILTSTGPPVRLPGEPFRICPHQTYIPDPAARPEASEENYLSDFIDMELRWRGATYWESRCWSCPFCLTDYWIHAEEERLTLKVWQELGNSENWGHLGWDSQIAMTGRRGAKDIRHRHDFGRIRRVVREDDSHGCHVSSFANFR